jgi:hypothetical protein
MLLMFLFVQLSTGSGWFLFSIKHFVRNTITRLDHQHFRKMVRYCKESDSFSRMLVFEHQPNETLYEHFHGSMLSRIWFYQLSEMQKIHTRGFLLIYVHYGLVYIQLNLLFCFIFYNISFVSIFLFFLAD